MARPPSPSFYVCSASLLAATMLAACVPAVPRVQAGVPFDVPRSVRVRQADRIRVVPLEEYVLGAALSEITPGGQSPAVATRIFEVQAIIARTYTAANLGRHRTEGFDLCDTTHCQLYEPARLATSSYADVARDAVTRTAGRILRFNGRPAETVFHADCGGYSTTPADAWGGPPVPYLVAETDDVPGATHRSWQFSASADEWATLLNGNSSTRHGGRLRDLRVASRDGSGRVETLEIVGDRTVRVTGATVRQVVSERWGPRTMMSTRFSISRTVDGFRVDGTGFGHGVGLCQAGSVARARRGDAVDAILAHYYPGTR